MPSGAAQGAHYPAGTRGDIQAFTDSDQLETVTAPRGQLENSRGLSGGNRIRLFYSSCAAARQPDRAVAVTLSSDDRRKELSQTRREPGSKTIVTGRASESARAGPGPGD